jgi:hypothetical protein
VKRRFAIVVLALCSACVLGSAGAWAKRKPSTPEDRAQAVRYAHELEANPLSDDAASKRKWLVEWYDKVPDITVVVCDLLGPFPEGEHPFMSEVLGQMIFSNGAFQIEHPDLVGDKAAVQTAGLEGALKVDSAFDKAMPQGRVPFLDELLEKQSQGHLSEYVKAKVATGCGK